MRKRSESRAAKVTGKSYTVNLAALHVFVYGLAPNGKRLSLETENRHKSAQEENNQLPEFCPFRAQDSNVDVQIEKVGL
jgi:hypothetical protein